MAKFAGTVQFINQKEFNGKVLHSFKLVGESGYYNCGTTSPNISKNSKIEFEGEALPTGNVQVNVASIVTTKEASKEEVASGSTRGSFKRAMGGNNAKDKYWENKELMDVERQKVIQLQSSRNSAIAMAALILQASAVPGFAKAKPAEQMDILTGLVDHLTEKYQEDTKNMHAQDTTTDAAGEEALPDPSLADVDEWS